MKNARHLNGTHNPIPLKVFDEQIKKFESAKGFQQKCGSGTSTEAWHPPHLHHFLNHFDLQEANCSSDSKTLFLFLLEE